MQQPYNGIQGSSSFLLMDALTPMEESPHVLDQYHFLSHVSLNFNLLAICTYERFEYAFSGP